MRKEIALLRLALCLVLACAGTVAVAQDSTATETSRRDALRDNYRIEQELRRPYATRSGLQIGALQPDLSEAAKQSDRKVFKLKDVVFEGNVQSISPSELAAIKGVYTTMQKVSMRDLYRMVADVDALFDRKGVVGRAVLPQQEIENGVVRVQIIEAKVGALLVDSKRPPFLLIEPQQQLVDRLHPGFTERFVQNQLRIEPGEVVDVEKMEKEIMRFNRSHRKQLRAELKPGDELGYTDVQLTAISPQPVSFGYVLDNTGRRSSGRLRNGAFVQTQDLIGLDESFFCSYDRTKGTEYTSMYGDVPISRNGTWLELGYDYGTPQTIYGPFSSLNINGTSKRWRPGVRQLIRNEEHNRTEITFNYETYDANTYFGADLNYGERLTGYSLGISDVARNEHWFQLLSVSAQLGTVGVVDSFSAGQSVRSNYSLVSGAWVEALTPNDDWTFLGKVNGQLATSDLSQSRIFQIGGMATVRGVDEGLLTGDSGYCATLEGRKRIWHATDKDRLEAFGFADNGCVFYRGASVGSTSHDVITSVGGGFNYLVGTHFSATAGYGQPIFLDGAQETYRDDLRDGNFFASMRVQY